MYSFPSKMIEYMLSGTPVLTTKLPGIPEAYYDYCYTVEHRESAQLALQIDFLLKQGHEKRDALGKQAQGFVVAEKNYWIQAQKIVDFLKQQS